MKGNIKNRENNVKELILVLTNHQERNVTTSLIVAKVFRRNHADVLRDIRNLHCSPEFRNTNFADRLRIMQLDIGESRQKYYEITKDGFNFLIMGYTGKKASQFKEMFIKEFNRREAMLKNDDYIVNRALNIMKERTKAIERNYTERQ